MKTGVFVSQFLVLNVTTLTTNCTPPTFVSDVEVRDEVDSPRSVREISLQLEVSTPLTLAVIHLRCLDRSLGCC
jgi:hypothetical protein